MEPLIFVTFAGIPRPVFLFQKKYWKDRLFFKGKRDHFLLEPVFVFLSTGK